MLPNLRCHKLLPFLPDVDIITLQNPFGFLARDSDVESMSDGWDAATAYGYNDVLGGFRGGAWQRVHGGVRVRRGALKEDVNRTSTPGMQGM